MTARRLVTLTLLAFTLPILAQDGAAPATAASETRAELPVAATGAPWPRKLVTAVGTVVIHTPETETWHEFVRVEARSAVEITPAGETETAYGVVKFSADTDVDIELRLVIVENIKITSTNFPGADKERSDMLDKLIRKIVPAKDQSVPLDVVLSYVASVVTLPETKGLSFDPPPIFYSETPARLIITDGDPLLAPIPDTKLKYVINTNWDLFRYKDKTWYLRDQQHWLKNSAEDLNDEWNYTTRLPGDLKKLPDDENWQAVNAAIPAEKTKEAPPTLFVSDRPAELILTEGRPFFTRVGDPGLDYVTNTESDLFRFDGHLYYLVSGRWFRAETLRGPWSHVSELPPVFSTIPRTHKKAHVRVSIPNTEEAILAAIEATVPRKAQISRDAGKYVSVTYQGEPDFRLIESTQVYRAINSPNDVFKVGNKHYLCDSAVWYVAVTPDGPWEVATTVPQSIYSIPASSPAHHVTYVYIYDTTTNYVSSGYTSGYYGVYISYGVVIYGSGYRYYPYYYPYYRYPIYYPYPYSYGFRARYNPRTGRYSRSARVYGPYGGFGRTASYNPRTGTYARGAAVWNRNEIAASGAAYNPRTGTKIATNQYRSGDGGWGQSVITRDDKWIKAQSEWDQSGNRTTEITGSEGGTANISRSSDGDTVTREGSFQKGDQSLDTKSMRNESGAAAFGAQTGDGSQAGLVRTEDGNIYAGKDGEVYKRGEDGWYKHSGDDWNKVDAPTERAAQIDQRRSESGGDKPADRTSTGDFNSNQANAGNRELRSTDNGIQNRTPSNTYSTRPESQPRSQVDSLNSSRNARQQGYQRYNNRRSGGSSNRNFNRGGMSRGGGRRR